MQYVVVYVSDPSYHGTGPLTYSSAHRLPVGSLVYAPLKQKRVIGIVAGNVDDKPAFTVKPVELIELPPLPEQLLSLIPWIHAYYPAPLGTVVQQLLPRALPKKDPSPLHLIEPDESTLPPLHIEQKKALTLFQDIGMHLLHGDTGTGKTRVYIELALKAYRTKKSSLIITPEIGLTSQLERSFKAIFGERVILLHSQLTEATRRKLWLSVLTAKEPLVIIGPRSALFSPIKNVGLIVLDESHETAYKQDKNPYYHTAIVGSVLAAFHSAPFVLGSATPSITDYYVAAAKKRPIIRMTQTATDSATRRTVSVVDLRDHEKFSKNSHLSDELIKEIKNTLQRKEQALLFLNRRGTARIIMCERCGWQATCPNCDLPLVYHNDTHTIRCHSCNFQAKTPSSCSDCNNASVIFKSIGTKAITEEVKRLFPEARVSRYDTDNKKGERIEHHFDAIHSGEVDILVGTQTLAKGLDLPKLSLVGVIIADTSLYVPDFSAQERTYQLLHQVVGRVGRGHRDGHVIIQTYSPESPILEAITTKDWQRFYTKELAEREQFAFPPYCYLLKLWCRRASRASAESSAQKLADQLRQAGLRIQIEGPAPAFHEKVESKFQWQLVIKARQRSELIKVIQQLPNGWSHDIDPMNLL